MDLIPPVIFTDIERRVIEACLAGPTEDEARVATTTTMRALLGRVGERLDDLDLDSAVLGGHLRNIAQRFDFIGRLVDGSAAGP